MLKYALIGLAIFLVVPLTKILAADTKDAPPTITWEKTFEGATTKAKSAGKPILLDFFSPAWTGCKTLGAVTYPDATVIDYINKNFIPLQVNVQSGSDLLGKYRAFWTPTIIILDSQGTEYYRFNGFLPPDEFIPQLQFGLGFMSLEKQDYKVASSQFKALVDKYPKSDIAPEAQYWFGVSEYKSAHNLDALLNAWKKLRKDYPNSIWAKKVAFIKEWLFLRFGWRTAIA